MLTCFYLQTAKQLMVYIMKNSHVRFTTNKTTSQPSQSIHRLSIKIHLKTSDQSANGYMVPK